MQGSASGQVYHQCQNQTDIKAVAHSDRDDSPDRYYPKSGLSRRLHLHLLHSAISYRAHRTSYLTQMKTHPNHRPNRDD